MRVREEVKRLAMVTQMSGCKVGWETYDDEAEAIKASERAKIEADQKWQRGYDFGYLTPGEITHRIDPVHGEVWVVVTP